MKLHRLSPMGSTAESESTKHSSGKHEALLGADTNKQYAESYSMRCSNCFACFALSITEIIKDEDRDICLDQICTLRASPFQETVTAIIDATRNAMMGYQCTRSNPAKFTPTLYVERQQCHGLYCLLSDLYHHCLRDHDHDVRVLEWLLHRGLLVVAHCDAALGRIEEQTR